MDAEIKLVEESLWLSLLLGGIPIAATTLVGTVIAIFQAATQVQEQTLPLLPKILTLLVIGWFGAAFALESIDQFMTTAFESLRFVP